MSRNTTLGAAATALFLSWGSAHSHDGITFAFAECAGRFSAEMEHAWLMNDPAADHFAANRASFVDLATASMGPDQGRAVLSHRIDVKLAHAALLQQATFGTSRARAQSAKNMAARQLTACKSLLLGS